MHRINSSSFLLFLHLLIAFATAQLPEQTPSPAYPNPTVVDQAPLLPQNPIIADEIPLTEPTHTQQGITALRNFATEIHIWSSKTTKAVKNYRYHLTYCPPHVCIKPRPEPEEWSILRFRNGSDLVPVSPILKALNASVSPLESLASQARAFSQAGVPNVSTVRRLNCFCKAYNGTSWEPDGATVNWVIAVARNQTESYLRMIDSSVTFLEKANGTLVQLDRLDGVLEGQRMDQSTREGRELGRIQELRKNIEQPPFKPEEPHWLHHWARELSKRMDILTALNREPDTTAERTMASIDFACSMSAFDDSVSIGHTVVGAWTAWVGC